MNKTAVMTEEKVIGRRNEGEPKTDIIIDCQDIMQYPRDFANNVRFRAKLIATAEKNPQFAITLYELCRRDIIKWIDLFCWTKDPRRRPSDIRPFICYDFQRGYVKEIEDAIDKQYDRLTEKSRDMGVSWICLYVIMHKWLFERGSDFRIGSRKEEFVDRPKVIDTLFEKIRFNLLRQPKWLMPVRFKWEADSTYMKIYNPDLGNTIIGESANEDFGSGGRSKAVLLDEYSKWDNTKADAAWTATADVTKCRLAVSTPKGSANKFALLANGHDEKIEKSTLHWTLHPIKAEGAYYFTKKREKKLIHTCEEAFKLWKAEEKVRSPWYDIEADRRSMSDLAQEVDIDYLRSGSPFFDMQALSNQTAWEYFRRTGPSQPVPSGKFIRANLLLVDHKIKVLERPDGFLKIYEMPNAQSQYTIGADSSEGLPKGDEATMILREKWTGNVCAAMHGAYPPEDLAEMIILVEKYYKNVLTAPENNSNGYTLCKDLEELGSNLYFTRRDEVKSGIVRVTPKRGWSTTRQSRADMVNQMAEEIRRSAFELRDAHLIAQCRTFVHNERTGRPEADGSFLDDMVIACAIAGAVIQQVPYKAPQEKRISRVAHTMRRRRNAGFSFSKV